MINHPFENEDLLTVSDALDIAEDKTGDFYKFSLGQWKRHRYDVETSLAFSHERISSRAFAQLNKCSRAADGLEPSTKRWDFYIIRLQDEQILKAVMRDEDVDLLALLVYVFTHELVHIVRFSNFLQRFEITGENRVREEGIVHETTFEILKNSSLPNMNHILESYESHRTCDLAFS